jgi:ADP-ribose pyrophosphatase YjhB (NUDIX family)
MSYADGLAQEGQQVLVHDAAGHSALVVWCPPSVPAPDGTRHGSAAVCFTAKGEIVLVREEGKPWGLPGGRPEANETWRQTLDREVLEEACALVEDATLLGFTRGTYLSGPEQGLVLVRSFWRAKVSLQDWQPEHEIADRLLVAPDEALDRIAPVDGWVQVFQRILYEATVKHPT